MILKLERVRKIRDPFNKLVEIIRRQGSVHNPITSYIGAVACVTPLIINVNGVQLDRSDLLINKVLLSPVSNIQHLHNFIKIDKNSRGIEDSISKARILEFSPHPLIKIYDEPTYSIYAQVRTGELLLDIGDKVKLVPFGDLFILELVLK